MKTKNHPNFEYFKKLYLMQRDLLLSRSEFLLEAKNISDSGKTIEDFFKEMLNQIFNNRFRATTGHIIYSKSKEAELIISPHVDIIIVDNLVPNVLFHPGGLNCIPEFVPQESVVGILEVKKTLNKKVVEKALKQLSEVMATAHLLKNDDKNYIPGGIELTQPLTSLIHNNPVIGVVGVTHSGKDISYNTQGKDDVDIIFTLDGFLQVIAQKEKDALYAGKRGGIQEFDYIIKPKNRTNILPALGYLTYYLYRTSGRILDIEKYYGNVHLIEW